MLLTKLGFRHIQMSRILKISERLMLSGERRIPELAAKSGLAAHRRALASTGAVVLATPHGELIERLADGSVKVIKAVSPGKRVKVGTVFTRAR